MEQKIPYTQDGLLSRALIASEGAVEHADDIPLLINTPVAILGDRTTAAEKRALVTAAFATLRGRRQALFSKRNEVRRWLTLSRDNLKPSLGGKYSAVWDATGFVGSLSISMDPGKLLVQLETMAAYYTYHTGAQLPDLNLTGAQAFLLFDNLKTTHTAMKTQETVVRTAVRNQNEAFDALRRRLVGLVAELRQRIGPLDARWSSYGFNMPGAKRRPEAPTGVEAVLIGPTAVSVKWAAAPRATYYRVWKKEVGVDLDFVPVGSPADLDCTIEHLSSNSVIEIVVSAMNSGGESARSEVVSVSTL